MSRRAIYPRQTPLRRLAAVLAVLGLVFASTFASLSHSVAMAAMATSALQTDTGHGQHAVSGHDQHRHDDAVAGHHHHGDHQSADVEKAPVAPCEDGCLLCKDCSFGSVVLQSPAALVTPVNFAEYGLRGFALPVGITPSQQPEPPRS